MKKECGVVIMCKHYTMIVGATGFLGSQIACHLSERKHNLILVCLTNIQKAEELSAAFIKESQIDCYAFQCDIRIEAKVKELFDNILKKNIYIDQMVFVAVNPIVRIPIEQSNPEQWQSTVMTGIFGLYLCSCAVFRQFQSEYVNRIIVISSTSAFGGMPLLSDYAAVKSAQIGFAKSLALEGADKNVRVNVIAPGLVQRDEAKTDIERIRVSPIRRLTKVEDIFHVLDFLSSIESEAITGQVIVLDAGNDVRYRYLLE